MDLVIRELTQTTAVFYNESQTIVGEIRATHSPRNNIVELDEFSEALNEEQEQYLEQYLFSNYH